MDYPIDERLKKPVPTIEDVHEIFKKWIYLEDTGRIDIALATRLIAKISGTRVWILFVGPSGDWKSELLNAISDPKETKVIMNITAKTLVNGNPHVPDLAPLLKDKTIIIPDMAQILKLHPNEKAEVWAQLRDLYDGIAGKQSGMGKDVKYDDLNITLMAASTPAIDSQILIHQDLGTRELIYRTEKAEKTKIMDMVWDNEVVEDLMHYELKEIVRKFLECKSYDKTVPVLEEVKKQLFYYALKLTYFRAPAEVDKYSGELLNQVYPEKPTRILKQLKRIYLGLKALDENYPDEEALKIIKHIVRSSSFKNRTDIMEFLVRSGGSFSTYAVSTNLKLGMRTCFKELGILWNLGLVRRDANYDDANEKLLRCEWYPDETSKVVQGIYEELEIEREEEQKELKVTEEDVK